MTHSVLSPRPTFAKSVSAASALQRPLLGAPRRQAFRVFGQVAPRIAAAKVVHSRLAPQCEVAADAKAPSAMAWLAGALLAAGAPLTLAAAALAEPLNGSVGAKQADAVVKTATELVTENTSQAPSGVEFLLVLSPLLLYGIFSLYRSKVNPRAKLSDFAFIVVGLVIVANLISIIVFKVRYF